jgi:tetraacyldisaccharide 4'-kinase
MRAKLESWLNRQWYGATAPALALRALVPVYRGLRALDQALKKRELKNVSADLPPIIVAGNLTVGGTGKTPLVIWLIEQALRDGLKPGVISRGYGGSHTDRHVALMVHARHTDWRACGDEALLIVRRTGVPVAVCRDRIVAAQALSTRCDVLISDDGLQNITLPRCTEILVIDGTRRFGNERLLPAGPLREALPKNLSARYPLRVCSGVKASENPGEFAMTLIGDLAVNSKTGEQRALAAFRGAQVYALAGIGNPQRFYQSLSAHGIDVQPVPLGDHGVLSTAIWQRLTAANSTIPLLMTEKDAVKYAAHESCWVIPISAQIDATLWQKCRAKTDSR